MGTWSPASPVRPASAAVAVMIFIVEPGGCSAENAIPASASSRAGARVHHHHAGVLAAQRGDGGPLHRRVDRGGHRRGSGSGVRAGQHAMAGQQRAAGRPGELVLEDVLQSVEPHLGVGRVALRGIGRRQRRRDRPQRADDLLGDIGDRRGAVGPLARAACRRWPAACRAAAGRSCGAAARPAAAPGTGASPERRTRAPEPLPVSGTSRVSGSVPQSLVCDAHPDGDRGYRGDWPRAAAAATSASPCRRRHGAAATNCASDVSRAATRRRAWRTSAGSRLAPRRSRSG